MSDEVQIRVNGTPVRVPVGIVLAAALARLGVTRFRRSVLGQPRGPLCGMGVCLECCVTLNGQRQQRSCQTLCEEGMDVRTDE